MERLEPFPFVHTVVALNPLTPFIRAYQETIFFGQVPSVLSWASMIGVSVAVWCAGAWLFERLSETLVEAV